MKTPERTIQTVSNVILVFITSIKICNYLPQLWWFMSFTPFYNVKNCHGVTARLTVFLKLWPFSMRACVWLCVHMVDLWCVCSDNFSNYIPSTFLVVFPTFSLQSARFCSGSSELGAHSPNCHARGSAVQTTATCPLSVAQLITGGF